MIIGVPKEMKPYEYRVALLPVGTETLVKAGHRAIIQDGAGLGSGITNEDYQKAGAEIVSTMDEVYQNAEMMVKVKEPMPEEYNLIKQGMVIFTYFHFAANIPLAQEMLARKPICIAYETIQEKDGSLPLLTPMSEVAGRMAIQEGAKYLEKPMMGRGILLGGVPGVAPANVVILGGGIVGTNAAKVAAAFGAQVTIMDINMDRLRYLDDIMPKNVVTLMSNAHNIRDRIKEADLLIGAVLVPGSRTPSLVTRDMIKTMKPGAVIVDVSVDQGGCIETTRPTTHYNPTFVEYDVVHYCVTNIPGAVGRTSSYALTNVTLPFVLQLANKGWRKALTENPALLKGLNIANGKVTFKAIAETLGLEYYPAEKMLNQDTD
ncbi:MAG: alanine dehydrogenase [Candidatus Poribacteria bacterium]|nr:alanine dehydrogenase [Candidatus Poribacteria bacterium]